MYKITNFVTNIVTNFEWGKKLKFQLFLSIIDIYR